MNIEWKEINPDYIVSSDGQVGSRKRGGLRMLRTCLNHKGYPMVAIHFGGGVRLRSIHSLVAEAFLGPKPSPLHQVNHKNGVKVDNRDANLEWMTRSENVRHGLDVLGNKRARGEKAGHRALTEDQVREARSRAKRGESHGAIAASMGVQRSCISKIARNETWAWLV